jgi:hypothetical protein
MARAGRSSESSAERKRGKDCFSLKDENHPRQKAFLNRPTGFFFNSSRHPAPGSPYEYSVLSNSLPVAILL